MSELEKDLWLPNFLDKSPLYEPLSHVGAMLCNLEEWPSLTQLQRIIDSALAPARSLSGAAIRLVPQGSKPSNFFEKYEPRLYLNGELQVRTATWHDLFNVLVWATFPHTKAALNRRHFLAAEQRESDPQLRQRRSRLEDALTIFDEGGLIIASSKPELCELIKQFEWKELFWHRRQDVLRHLKCFVFGHALYEKALEPYLGVSGKAVFVDVDESFMQLTLQEQLLLIDASTACYLNDEQQVQTPADFSAFPLLGMPGWNIDNQVEHYYNNLNYFRPRKNR